MGEIRLKKLYKSFGRTAVIRGVDLNITNGEFCVFLGPSGCGKSTLLRLIAGLETVTAGSLHIGGREVTRLPPKERNVAMVFQSYALYPHMSAYENMAFGLKLAGRKRTEIEQRVRSVATILHIEDLLHRKPAELSGGQRQRVAIGRAIVREPGVFLFDEPLSNLDAELRGRMRLEFTKLHRQLEATMVYVTHDQTEAMTLAEKMVVINAGQIVQIGAPLELYQKPSNLFVAGFIGSPKMNLIRGQLTQTEGDRATVMLPGGHRVRVAVNATRAQLNEAVTVGIRPEHITLEPGHDNVLEGRVVIVEHLGDHALIYLEWDEHSEPMVLRTEEGDTAAVNENLRIGVPVMACHLFDASGTAFPRLI